MDSTTAEAGRLTLNPQESRAATALFERLFPADSESPGATAIGVVNYVDLALAGAERQHHEQYRFGLAALDRAAHDAYGRPLATCSAEQQDQLLAALQTGQLAGCGSFDQIAFFELLLRHLREGLFSDPLYGGNRNKLGWRVLGHPGIWLENSAEEGLQATPADKGGRIQSLEDVAGQLAQLAGEPPGLPGYDPTAGQRPPTGPADVVLIGVGAVGGLIAPLLAEAGLRVVGLEAGPWRHHQDYRPDELGYAFYARAGLGPKFRDEPLRWRRHAEAPTGPATASLGNMVNGVGGSIVHYGGWLRRFHPHHFQSLSRVQERWGATALPEGSTLADWPISYADLEPYFTRVEQLAGVAGDAAENPFLPRSQPLPLPPLRPFRMGELFRQATAAMGLHPHMVPAGLNSIPYDGRPATTYNAWNLLLGHTIDDKWHPGLSSVPRALATGNFDLRTGCRALRITTDNEGHTSGVDYVDALGRRQHQPARTVLLCSYTFENVRLLLLSGDSHHPNGLGNNREQVGRHFMTKMFQDVSGFFPTMIFNRHTGPAAQSVVFDDYVADAFDSVAHGFLGGATLSAEQQLLPLMISRAALPAGIPAWGAAYKAHLRQWQHWGSVRIQPDNLPYAMHRLDLDPHQRDRSGLGLPVVRITFDLQSNEQRLAAWMEEQSEAILRAMGATRCWRGPRLTGVASSHDLGGCRMGLDPAESVVDAELRVHDTPGLYVFSGAIFPSCPGINPTLTLWALCSRAAERLVTHLRSGGR